MNEPFFPMGSKRVRRFENSIRKRCGHLKPATIQKVYELLTLLPWFVRSRFEMTSDAVLVVQQGRRLFFPNPLPLIKHSHISFGYVEILKRKYCFPGFVEVEKDDVVVDCGAFVGGFAMSAVEIAGSVHLFEPSTENAACIRNNLVDRANVFINVCGLYNEDAEIKFNHSPSAVEHSILVPDDGIILYTSTITVKRLDTYFNHLGTVPDFVKIEAEGVEIEMFDGLGLLRPKKIAIDASPERNGESPIDELEARLNSFGYECQRRGFMLFARKRKS